MIEFKPGDRVTYSRRVGASYVDVPATVIGISVVRGRLRIQIDGQTDHLGRPKVTAVQKRHLVLRREP